MTITKTGGVSQNAVLADIGFGPGSLRQRPLYNRLSKTGGNQELDDFRGNACATQNEFVPVGPAPGQNDNAIGPNLDRSKGHHGNYPARDHFPVVSGNTLFAELSARGYWYSIGDGEIYYDPGGDADTEARFHFRINHSGSYRITGRIYTSGSTSGGSGYNRGKFSWQFAVVSGQYGYMEPRGAYNLDYNRRVTDNGNYNGSNSYTISQVVNLTTDRSYASMILYGISNTGGYYLDPSVSFYFENFKMVKT